MTNKVNTVTSAKIPKIINDSPEAAVVISKLNAIKDGRTNTAKMYTGEMPDISNSIKDKLKNNENITQLFPDVDLSIQILTSSILAPNDMLTTSLIYNAPEIKIPSDINSFIMDSIKKHIKENYSLTTKLTTILRESLFTKGSYIEAIIPEASLDQVINPEVYNTGEVSVENILDTSTTSKYGILGNAAKDIKYTLSNENFSIDNNKHQFKKELVLSDEALFMSVNDDLNIIATADKLTHAIHDDVSNQYSNLGVEENKDDLDKLFKRIKDTNDRLLISLPTKEDARRTSIGKPLIQKLPVESVIPVHVIGDVTKHIGYFVMLDEKGAPITSTKSLTMEDDNPDRNLASGDTKLNLIKKAQTALTGITKTVPKLSEMEELYSNIVSSRIKEKLEAGKYGDLVTINNDSDVYRVMFNRALKAQKTRLLFLPDDLVAFYAFDYRENGTGKSMLEKVSMLFSIRSIILFSRLMANIKNSVTTTEVSATLDDDDINPEQTMEKIISETMKTRQTQLPLGVTKIDDLVDWTHKVGYKFNFDHPGLPKMNISTSEENTSKVIPDDELDAQIQEHIIMSFGLTPEMVKSGFDPEFATTVLANNILLSKRIMQYQDQLSPMISDHVSKLIVNDPRIINIIKKIIKNNMTAIKKSLSKNIPEDEKALLKLLTNENNIIEYVTNMYAKHTTVSLPRPTSPDATNMKDAFEEYKGTLDDYLELIISEDAIPEEFMGDLSGKMDDIKSIVHTILIKKWMNDNNYLPEIGEFLTLDDEGKPVFNILQEYSTFSETLAKAILPFLKLTDKFKKKTNDSLDRIENGSPDDEDITPPDTTDDNTGDTTPPDTTDDNTGDTTPPDTTDDNTGGEDEGLTDI